MVKKVITPENPQEDNTGIVQQPPASLESSLAINPYVNHKSIMEYRENKPFFDTGIPSLNYALRKESGDGLPIGLFIELLGEDKSGKTALLIYLAKTILDGGGIVVWLQNECDLDRERCVKYGLDWDKYVASGQLLILEFVSIEETFTYMEVQLDRIIGFRKKGETRTIGMFLDSLVFNTNSITENNKVGVRDQGWSNELLKQFINKCHIKLIQARVLMIATNQLDKSENKWEKSHLRNRGKGGGKVIRYAIAGQILIEKFREWDSGSGYSTIVTIRNTKFGEPNKKTMLDFIYDTGLVPHSGIFHILDDSKFWKKQDGHGERLGSSGNKKFYHEKLATPFMMDKLWEDDNIREFMIQDLKYYYQNKIFKTTKADSDESGGME
ncbi:hypothetical protein M0R01_03635 [bacterium]|nr:hypothetical protein [bacterium]